jgi:hypothetical protein
MESLHLTSGSLELLTSIELSSYLVKVAPGVLFISFHVKIKKKKINVLSDS